MSDMTRNVLKNHRVKLIILILLVIVTYANSLSNGFVSDDVYEIVQNPKVGSLDSFTLKPAKVLRNTIEFVLIHTVGTSALFFRLVNILFHMGSVLVSYFILASIFPGSMVAFFGASLFAVHPIMSEAVVWISANPYVESTFFVLLSLLFYIHAKKSRTYYVLSVFFFFVAVTSSEKAVVFPLALLAYEIMRSGDARVFSKKIAPFFLVSVIVATSLLMKLAPHRAVLQADVGQPQNITLNPFIQIPVAISSYLKLFIWPHTLTLYHSEYQMNLVEYLLYLFVLVLMIGSIIYGYLRKRMLFFWLSFFVISLIPTLTPFGVSWIVAERYVYAGSLGIFTIVGVFFAKVAGYRKYSPAAFAVFAIILVLLSLRTIVRNTDWKNQDTLFISLGKTSPSDPKTHNNLGDLYARRGEYEKSVEEFKKAINLNPRYTDAMHNLANTYQQMGEDNKAIEWYTRALEIKPSIWQSRQNMGALFFSQKKYKEAAEQFELALEYNPTNGPLHTNLGIIYLIWGEKKDAQVHFNRALDLDPSDARAQAGLIEAMK